MIEKRHARRTFLTGLVGGIAASVLPIDTNLARAEDLTLDLRKMSEPRLYQITMRAISTGYDHAYVTMAAEDDAKAMSYEAFYGFYPNDPASGSLPKEIYRFIVKGVPGAITKEDRQTLNLPSVHEITAKIDSESYKASMKMLDKWKGQTEYKLGFNDCVTFAADMARTVGLKVPNRLFKGPVDYMASLVNANRPK